jgi:hypothetical protein
VIFSLPDFEPFPLFVLPISNFSQSAHAREGKRGEVAKSLTSLTSPDQALPPHSETLNNFSRLRRDRLENPLAVAGKQARNRA